jgi:hypothetical protein
MEQKVKRVRCTYSIFLQITRIRYPAEFVHPTGWPRSPARPIGSTPACWPSSAGASYVGAVRRDELECTVRVGCTNSIALPNSRFSGRV